MNFALVTAHNTTYQPLADITWNQNKRLYAERWGYDAIAKIGEYKYDVSQISFERTELIINLLESGKYDWIHACGCDTMITNFTIPLSDIADNNYDFVIATDCYNINNDSFLARATPLTISWLKHIVSIREEYANAKWLDQSATQPKLQTLALSRQTTTWRSVSFFRKLCNESAKTVLSLSKKARQLKQRSSTLTGCSLIRGLCLLISSIPQLT